MTRKRAIRVFLSVGIAALSLGTWAVAQTSVTLTGPPPGYAYDGIYMSPYYATVGGATNTAVVCDDFGDESTLSTWNATITPFSGISPTNTSWSLAGKTLTQYDAVAWLTLQVLQQTPGTTGQIIYSFADWALFDPNGVASYLTNNPVTSGLTTADLCNDIFGAGAFSSNVCHAGTGGLLGSAYGASVPSGGYNLEIISPDITGTTKICQAETGCAAQEFIAVAVPEGGAAVGYLLLAGLSCLGAVFVRSRRQIRDVPAA
jgi:hypothetical protein